MFTCLPSINAFVVNRLHGLGLMSMKFELQWVTCEGERFKFSQVGVKCPSCKDSTKGAEVGSHFHFRQCGLQNMTNKVARGGVEI